MKETGKIINIVYYTYINPLVDYKYIIQQQLKDIINSNILTNIADLYIIISCEYMYLIGELVELIEKTMVKGCEKIKYHLDILSENIFEYYGISKIYELAIEYPEKYYIYFHGKGMFNISNDLNARMKSNIILTRGTLQDWEKTLDLFIYNENISFAGLFPSPHFIWFNFWWASGKYLITCQLPVKERNYRHYFESWLGTGRWNEIYNLCEMNNTIYSAEDACKKLMCLGPIFPVIVCIAKYEEDYIEEFVKYHLALGFKQIYLYDNEDEPTYSKLLDKYKDSMVITHLPGNNYDEGVQYIALKHFVNNFMNNPKITHIAHIDIDEFIVLKKHASISDFIYEFITGDCEGIGMNWRFFGSSGKTEKTNDPIIKRFTMCEKLGNHHIKTIFKKDNFISFKECHSINISIGHIKSTNGTIIDGAFNEDIDFSVIQLNHYKCKTFSEFKYIRSRGRADFNNQSGITENVEENVEETFKIYDINEIENIDIIPFFDKII